MRKILVIEDDKDIRQALTETLELFGYEVYQANNGQLGFEILAIKSVDLIILDYLMPVMRGDAFLIKLRAMPEYVSLPVIGLTAIAADLYGANVALAKPVEIETLLEHIDALTYMNKVA